MQRPKMIMFDYGQTLITESRFDGEKGCRAVLKYAKRNPYNVTGKEVQDFAKALNKDIGRFNPDVRSSQHIEVHNHIFNKFLYEYYDLEIDLSPQELEKVFWDNASTKKVTKNIEVLLQYLREVGIRSAVISNISFSGKALENQICALLPNHNFEFIIATSEYVFRKPHNRIFELALRKAKLAARDVWFCGDNAYFDVEGASKAGIFAIWYRGAIEEDNKLTPLAECLTVNDWTEIVDILDKNFK